MSWVWVGVGAAVGATAGAISGSRTGGDDVWKQALGGAALGGAAGGAGYAAFGAEAAAPAVAAEVAAPEVVATGGTGILAAPATATTTTAPAASGIMTVEAPNAAAGLQSLESGVVNPSVMTPGIEAPQGAFGTSFNTANTGNALVPPSGMVQPPVPLTVEQTPNAAAGLQSLDSGVVNPSVMRQGIEAPQGAFGTSFDTGASTPSTADSPLKKGFESAWEWVKENPGKTGILGFGALSLSGILNQDNDQEFGGSSVTPAGYPMSPNFRPSRYQPTRDYAEGGPVQSGMFPQSQYDKTQFATPSQMPISREVVGADYDAVINPYTGDLPRFAEGGTTKRDRDYGLMARQYAAMTDQRAQAQTPDTPDWVRSRGVYHDEDPDTKYEDALTAAQTRMGKAASRSNVRLGAMQKPTPMGQLNLGPVAGQEERKATGGIASLGGYAHGGNPRLLRGPGDGMSDDIPATIADKQPARLADGEFVVPADVVSGLGNGSTEAGAKKLHQMMDKVRVDRTGTKKQGKEIDADKYLPGAKAEKKAAGGIAHFALGGPTGFIGSIFNQPQGLYLKDGQLGTYSETGEFTPYSGAQTQSGPATNVNTKPQGFGVDNDYWKTGAGDIKYDPYTLANRPSAAEPQFYGNIYRGNIPDYSTPGYTLSGNLGEWSNVMGEQQRAAQPASLNQQVTQSYLQNLGRAPETAEFNKYMQSGMTAPQIQQAITASPENVQRDPSNLANVQAYLENMYQQNLGRAPDVGGLDYWTRQITQGGKGVGDVESAMQGGPEAQIRRAYQQYLGRAADQGGQQYWTGQVGSGQMTLDQAINAIKGSEEGKAYAAKQEAPKEEKKRRGGILAAKK